MELKDVILSTLAEMEESAAKPQRSEFEIKEKIVVHEQDVSQTNAQSNSAQTMHREKEYEKEESSSQSELMYLKSIRERLLVLFEGFQAPNNKNIEAKIDMTLNFLEYTLATIDSRVEMLEKGKLK